MFYYMWSIFKGRMSYMENNIRERRKKDNYHKKYWPKNVMSLGKQSMPLKMLNMIHR